MSMSNRGKRKWAPEATLVIPDPNITPFDIDTVDQNGECEGLLFEVDTTKMSVHALYQFNELVSRLCDCDVMVIHIGKDWSTICVLTSDERQVEDSLDDAALFFTETITIRWEKHPRKT